MAKTKGEFIATSKPSKMAKKPAVKETTENKAEKETKDPKKKGSYSKGGAARREGSAKSQG